MVILNVGRYNDRSIIESILTDFNSTTSNQRYIVSFLSEIYESGGTKINPQVFLNFPTNNKVANMSGPFKRNSRKNIWHNR